MKHLLSIILFLSVCLGFSQEPQVVSSVAFGDYLSPLVKIKKQGREYYVHPFSGHTIDKVEEHAADLFVVIKDGAYGVLKEDGNLIVPFEYDNIKLHAEYDGQWYEGIPYKYKFIILKKNGKVGAANENGDIVVPLQYQDAEPINKNVIAIAEDNLWGWVSALDGTTLQQPAYEYVSDFFNDEYVEVRNGELAGLALNSGELIVPVEYEGFMRFLPNGKNTLFEGIKEKKSFLFNTSGKLISYGHSDYKSIADSDQLIFKENDRYGILDPEKQQVVAAPEFEIINDFIRGLATAKKNSKYGVIDTKGKAVIGFEYDEVRFLSAAGHSKSYSAPVISMTAPKPSHNQDEKLKARLQHEVEMEQQPYVIEIKKGQSVSVADWQGKIFIAPDKYQAVRPVYYMGSTFFEVTRNGKFGMLDEKGAEMVPPHYEHDLSYQFSASAVEYEHGIYGRFIPLSRTTQADITGFDIGLFDLKLKKTVIQPAQQTITILTSEWIKIRKTLPDYTYELYVYDIKQEKPIPLPSDVVDFELINNRFLMQQLRDDTYRLTDLNGKKVYDNPQWSRLGSYHLIRFPHVKDLRNGEFYHGLKKVYADEGNLFIDEKGIEKRFEDIDQVDDFYEGVALAAQKVANEEGRSRNRYLYGVVDLKGNAILPFEYDEVTATSGNSELLQVRKGELFGLIRRDGTQVLPVVYNYVESVFDYPNRIVAKNEKYGLVDSLGKVLIEPMYDDIRRNSYGTDKTWPLLVQDGEWYYFVDSNGQKSTIKSKQKHY